MGTQLRRDWTESERARLRELAQQGASSGQIRLILGRSEGNVIAEAIRLGVTFSTHGPRRPKPDAWTEGELQRLLTLVAEGKTTKEIASLLGRSPAATGTARSRFGALKSKFKQWSTEQDKKLIELWDAGLKVSEIARQLGRSWMATKMRRLKLDVAQRNTLGRKWASIEDATLRRHAEEGLALKASASILNRSVNEVKHRRRVLGLTKKKSEIPRPSEMEVYKLCDAMWERGEKPTTEKVAREMCTFPSYVESHIKSWVKDKNKDAYDMRSGPLPEFDLEACISGLPKILKELIGSLKFSKSDSMVSRQRSALEVLLSCEDKDLRASLALYIVAVFSSIPRNLPDFLRRFVIRWDVARNLLHPARLHEISGDMFYADIVNGVLNSILPPSVKVEIVKTWSTMANKQALYLEDLDPAMAEELSKYAIKPLQIEKRNARIFERSLREEQKKARKQQTDEVFPYFYELRFGAEVRTNEIMRLAEATAQATASALREERLFPFEFSYQESVMDAEGRAYKRQVTARLYDLLSTFRAAAALDQKTGNRVAAYERGGLYADPANFFVEIVSVERLDHIKEPPPWYVDFIKHALFRQGARGSWTDSLRSQFNLSWGYRKNYTWGPITGLGAYHRGLVHDLAILREAGIYLFEPEVILARCLFGNLAVQMATRTAARLGEILQVAATPDCIHALDKVGPNGVRRWVLSLVPKGRDQPEDYFVDEHVKKAILQLVSYLYKKYKVKQLPEVRGSRREKKKDRYVFQYDGRRLDAAGVTACLRFLLHDLVRTTSGKILDVTAHVFRHNFATEMKRLGAPDEVVRELLHQKDVKITGYYSKPTKEMIQESVEAIFVNRIDIRKAIRSPTEIGRILREAEGKIGALSEVIGGTCVVPNMCSAKWVCVGCSGNAPDPKKRSQVEKKKQWAAEQRGWAAQLGLDGEVRQLEKTIADCERMLREMDLMEAAESNGSQVVEISLAPKTYRDQERMLRSGEEKRI